MANTVYHSYDMHGIKEEFANWVSNIDPVDVPFTSMISKFTVKNTTFNWQEDHLATNDATNAAVEGSDASNWTPTPTEVITNFTQIMRKVIMVSDTANAVSSHGREKELFYQLKKAAKEIKRDQETVFLLKDQAKRADKGSTGSAGGSDANAGRHTASLGNMIDDSMKATMAVGEFEKGLFDLTEKLYTAGSDANIIMFHPSDASKFAALQEVTDLRHRIFENSKEFVKQVNSITDPLGQTFKVMPNRWLPENTCYIFNPSDISTAVLRAPQQIRLNKTGSSEKYMIEQEVGLRLNNAKAAAVYTTL